MNKVLVIVAVLLSLIIVLPVQAGCPRDIADVYGITNMSCQGDCENWFVRSSVGEPATYFYKNTTNCNICNIVRIDEFLLEADSVSIGGMEMVGGVGSVIAFHNGQAVYEGIKSNKNGTFLKDTFELKYGEHRFTFNIESVGETPKIANFNCKENCDGVKVLSYKDDTVRYDGCGDPARYCNAATVYNHPDCGGGYSVLFEYYPKGKVRLHDAPLSESAGYFTKEEMRDVMPMSTTIMGKTVFTYDLVKNEPVWIEKIDRLNKMYQKEGEWEKQQALNTVVAMVLAWFGLLVVLFLLFMKLRSKRAK